MVFLDETLPIKTERSTDMKKKRFLFRRLILMATALLMVNLCLSAVGESYSANVMRLLNYEGEVHILDADGSNRFIMENARFNSGETMLTGEASSASVSLDSSKIVTLDAVTKVEFVKDAGQLQMNLKTGTLFLDVQKKLDENESLDIQTTTMTVGIRGTIVYVSEAAPTDGISGTSTQLGVLEGTARLTYPDENGARRLLEVPAGNLVTISSVSGTASAPVVAQLTTENINSFAMGLLESDPALMERVEQAHGLLSLSGGEAGPLPASRHPCFRPAHRLPHSGCVRRQSDRRRCLSEPGRRIYDLQ